MTPEGPGAVMASHGGAPTPDRLLESAVAFWRSAMLLSAHEMGLFSELARGPRDGGALESGLGLRPASTADFLDALVALGFVERDGEHYRNTAEGNLYLDSAKPTYIGHWLAMASAALRELPDMTSHLRAAGANKRGQQSLANRMWADIADILRVARADDGA